MNTTNESADHAQIRALLLRWAHMTQAGHDDEVLAHHAADVLIFDVLAPLQYHSAAAYRSSWPEWQPQAPSYGFFKLHELVITASTTVAFAHGLLQCGYTRPDGTPQTDWVRATFGLQKQDSQWWITHQHGSMPVSRN